MTTGMFSHVPTKSLVALAVAAALCGGTASAQQDADDETEEARGPGREEIVVTGSRIRRNDFSSPNATTVVTSEDMENLGVHSIAEMMRQMPNNIGAVTPENGVDGAFFVGSTIANLRGLNTYYGTRTLTLVDSKRFVSTNNGGGVDLNFIPSAIVGQMETVTGGASASYGADAIAGVVNVVLDKDLDGYKLDASFSETGKGDGDRGTFSFAGGTDLFEGRGHITVAVEHSDQKGIDDCTTREYCRRSMGYFENGSAPNVPGTFSSIPYSSRTTDVIFPGQPQFILTDGMRFTNLPTGIIEPTGTSPGFYTFNEAGTDIVPIYNDLSPEAQALLGARGDGPGGVTPFGLGALQYAEVPLLPETQRDNLYTYLSYELDSGIELTGELSYGVTQSIALQSSFANSYDTTCVRADNAYLLQGSPEMQQAILERQFNGFFGSGCATAPFLGGSFAGGIPDQVPGTNISKDLSTEIDRRNDTETDVTRVVLGANGDLFDGGSWTWDTYFQYGFTDRRQRVADFPSSSRQAMAKDAVSDAQGNIVCRVLADTPAGDAIRARWLQYFTEALEEMANPPATPQEYLDSLSEGCVPLNPFGTQLSPEARAYAYPSILEGSEITQRVASMTLSGEAWKGIGAGPLAMAAGIDSRQETTRNFTGDDPIAARDFVLNYGDAWRGRSTNHEAFVELELPLLRDKPGAQYLMANIADRRTQNKTERLTSDPLSLTRYASSWKSSLVWQPLDVMRFRLTRSSDTRAPAPRELYQTNTAAATAGGVSEISNPFRVDDPLTFGNETFEQYQQLQGSNSKLDEETSISETLGVVFTPGGKLGGLQASIDYYETSVQGGIDTVMATTVLNRCAEEVERNVPPVDQIYCTNVEFGPPDDSMLGTPGYEFSNVLTVASTQVNEEPFLSRGVDYSVSYFTQFSGGAAFSVRMFATRFLEQSVDLGPDLGRRNVSGQTGGNGLGALFGAFGTNYSPTPDISGNLFLSYTKNALTVTAQARYTGSGALYLQDGWIGEGEAGYFFDDNGVLQGPVEYDPSLDRTVSDSTLPSWTTMNLNFRYDFGRSPLAPSRFESLEAYLNIENVGDRTPDFYSGLSAGGINAAFFSGLGRQIELGLRMEF